MANRTSPAYIRDLAAKLGLHINAYGPGDGVKRYRAFDKPTDYFAGSGLYTSLGPAEMLTWLRGYAAGKGQHWVA